LPGRRRKSWNLERKRSLVAWELKIQIGREISEKWRDTVDGSEIPGIPRPTTWDGAKTL